MKRAPQAAQAERFDLLVIGGGIQGAVVCYKAAQRGLRVLLLEKDDFCAATSSNSLKILHGGLRYLQNLDFRRMRHSIRSRRELMRMAPHLVTPLPCLMPAYGHGLKGKQSMRLAMLLNDLVSTDRNRGLAPDKQLPAGHSLSTSQCLAQIPGIPTKGLHGASVWYDALADNTERLVLEYLLQAAELGASCINRMQVKSLARSSNGMLRVQALDRLHNRDFEFNAEYVINSAGACYEDLIPGIEKNPAPVRWARGLNIVINKRLFPETNGAVALEESTGEQKRMLFMVPWREHYTIIGTHYKEQSRDTALLPVTRDDIMALLDEVNSIYAPAGLRFDEVSFYHAGLLPMHEDAISGHSGDPKLAKESSIIDHGKQHGLANFFSIKGIKYTTAPQVAERVLGHIPEWSNQPNSRVVNNATIPGSKTKADAALYRKYGNRYPNVKPYLEQEPRWLDKGHRLQEGEVSYFMHEEMATQLDDVVFRRSELGTASCPTITTLQNITHIMADNFNWNDDQQRTEIDRVLQRYSPLQHPALDD